MKTIIPTDEDDTVKRISSTIAKTEAAQLIHALWIGIDEGADYTICADYINFLKSVFDITDDYVMNIRWCDF